MKKREREKKLDGKGIRVEDKTKQSGSAAVRISRSKDRWITWYLAVKNLEDSRFFFVSVTKLVTTYHCYIYYSLT